MKNGRDCARPSKNDLALEDFSKVIEAQPKDAEAYRSRIYLDRKLNENEKAIADLKKLLELKPNDADAKAQVRALEKKVRSKPSETPAP